ncbi:MAG: gliding motility-associated C-terminal domain-containing protein, partial [Phycisphaerae bacterium]|nr:gliding motility-associated C-terminal domain-containing protein [Saprospiraceae bacterium]
WQPSGVFQGLPAGNYLVSLRDSAGCTDSGDYVVGSFPPVLDSLVSNTIETCLVGGMLSVAAVSGTAPFEFQINGGPWQPSGIFQGLPAGNYIVSLRDSAGCMDSGNYVVGSTPLAQESLVSLARATCVVGGNIVVTAVSGTAPFEFQINGGPWQPSGVFQDLPAGNYLVSLRDSAGCTDSGDYAVGSFPPVSDSLVSNTVETCLAGGALSVAAVSGTAPFEFQINGGPWQPSGFFQDLPAGSYLVSLRDSAGCTDFSNYIVGSSPPVLDSLVSIAPPTCLVGGVLSLTAVSGTAPFEFQINGGPWQPSGLFPDLPAGNYSITLRDAAGCTHQRSFHIEEEEPLILRLDSIGNVDCRHPFGFVAVSATGGFGNYTYEIDHGSAQNQVGYFPGLMADVYAATVTDSVGCEATISGLEVLNFIDSALTKETVTIYEGTYYQLPDGRRTAIPGQYPFHYETAEGCDSLYLIDLIVLKRHIYVPNVFLPDDKGLNNFFTVYADASLENVPRLSVYDRWGELVFEKENLLPNDEENGWDGRFRGRPVNPGVFVWVAQLKFKDGLAFAIKGDVTVVR